MQHAAPIAALKYSFSSILIFVAAVSVVQAAPFTLDTISRNFPLANEGGGISASLDGGNVELFDVDFGNEIVVPASYSANETLLSAAGFTASTTRFGQNTSWRTVSVADDGVDGGADDAADSAIINATNALGRYQMAAYLVSQYNLGAGGNAANNGIQTAIWELLNPTSYSLAPFNADPSEALERAAVWFITTSSAGRDSYLADYRVLSDSSMNSCGPVLCGGFQEQIAAVPEPNSAPIPEPNTVTLCVTGFIAVFGLRRRDLDWCCLARSDRLWSDHPKERALDGSCLTGAAI